MPGKFDLAVTLTRTMFPYLLLVALAAQAMGVLNANNKFGMPALASTFFNVGSLTFGLTAGFVIGPHIGLQKIEGMAYGVVFGGAVQWLCQVPQLLKCGFVYRPRWDWRHEGLRRVLALMAPAIIGNAAVLVNVFINTSFAAGITDASGHVINGPVTWLNSAFRFMQMPLGLFGVAIASATLPSISRSAAANNIEEFRRTLSRSLGLVLLLTVPSSIGLAVLGEPMIAAVYQGGRFTLSDAHKTALALSCYAIGLAGYSAVKVLAPAFYALGDARTPMIVSLVSIAINYGAASTMIKVAGLGHAGLALSTSIVALCNFTALLALMRVRINGVHGRELFVSASKVIFASLAMGAVCYGSSHLVRGWLGISKWARIADLSVSVPLGLAVFYSAARALRVTELEMAAAAIAGRWRGVSEYRVLRWVELMHPEIAFAVRLQVLDFRMSELSKEIASLPKHIAEIEKKLEAHQRKLDADRAAQTANQKDRKKLEGDIQAQDQKISKLKDQMLQAKTNDQYKAFQNEIGFCEAEIRRAEDRILDLMSESEALEKNVEGVGRDGAQGGEGPGGRRKTAGTRAD